MMNAFMPIFCGVCAYITWYFIYKCDKKNKGKTYDEWKDKAYLKFISTLVVLLFLIHPQVT
jgi:hypothetical protein